MIEARTDRLWVRIGDLGEYHEPDVKFSLEDVLVFPL